MSRIILMPYKLGSATCKAIKDALIQAGQRCLRVAVALQVGESIRSEKSKSCGCNRKNPPNKENNRKIAIWKQLYKSTIEKRNKKKI